MYFQQTRQKMIGLKPNIISMSQQNRSIPFKKHLEMINFKNEWIRFIIITVTINYCNSFKKCGNQK